MPREIIPGSPDDAGFHVKVGWAPDEDVQVGVEGDDGKSLYWLLRGNNDEELAKVGRAYQDALHGDMVDDADIGRAILNGLDSLGHYEGVWTILDRHGCNRLIRTLRRARDSAFGRDE